MIKFIYPKFVLVILWIGDNIGAVEIVNFLTTIGVLVAIAQFITSNREQKKLLEQLQLANKYSNLPFLMRTKGILFHEDQYTNAVRTIRIINVGEIALNVEIKADKQFKAGTVELPQEQIFIQHLPKGVEKEVAFFILNKDLPKQEYINSSNYKSQFVYKETYKYTITYEDLLGNKYVLEIVGSGDDYTENRSQLK